MLRAKANRARCFRFFFLILLALSGFAGELPQRIVSLSPAMTELLFGIGAFDRVVGVSDYCTYPPEVGKLPIVGSWHHPSLEKITLLHPDLVIIDSGQTPFVADRFQELGLRVVMVPDRSIRDVYAAIATLGHVTGREQQAAGLAATVRSELEHVSRTTASRPRPSVVLVVDRVPGTLRNLNTATRRSFLGALVDIAGGRLVAPALNRDYGPLNKEDLSALDPDVILDFVHGANSRVTGDPLDAWREMRELKAVRTRRVYEVNEDFVPHASQRIIETAQLFARFLHPEAFSNGAR
jgi:iron complex transport system substrate-binding protein